MIQPYPKGAQFLPAESVAGVDFYVPSKGMIGRSLGHYITDELSRGGMGEVYNVLEYWFEELKERVPVEQRGIPPSAGADLSPPG